MYTEKQLEAGEGLYTNRRTTIWEVGEDAYLTTCDGETSGGECVGYAWPDGDGYRIEWV